MAARFCTECGSPSQPGDRFCRVCGQTLAEAGAGAPAAGQGAYPPPAGDPWAAQPQSSSGAWGGQSQPGASPWGTPPPYGAGAGAGAGPLPAGATPQFAIGELLNAGWEIMKAKLGSVLGILVGGYLLYLVALWIAFAVLGVIFAGLLRSQALFTIIIYPLLYISLSYFMGGVLTVMLKFARGQDPSFSDLFSKGHLTWKMLGAFVIIGIATGIGFVLLIVPGVYLMLRWGFAYFYVADDEMGPLEAMQASSNLTEGIKLRLLGVGIVLYLVYVAGFIAFGIGALITAPLAAITGTLLYLRLREQRDPKRVPAFTYS
ncbi:MAG: zinc ribbon domain-containing protein [Dehalococcoidia bacterium]